MVNFIYQGMAHSENSKKARKKGIERNNYYGRFERADNGTSYRVFIRKRK